MAVADTLYKIGASHSGDLGNLYSDFHLHIAISKSPSGEGIRKLAEFIKDTEAKREELV